MDLFLTPSFFLVYTLAFPPSLCSGYALTKFERYLQGSTANKKDKQAGKIRAMVTRVFDMAGIDDFTMYKVGDPEILGIIEEKFVDECRYKLDMSASTVKNYCSALTQWGDWLFMRNIAPSEFRKEEMLRLNLQKKKWFVNLTRDQKQQDTKRVVKDREECLTPLDFQKYLESNYARKVEEKLNPANGAFDDVEEISKREILEMRDHLGTLLCGYNALRPSGLCGMKREMFEKAVYYEQSENWVVEV